MLCKFKTLITDNLFPHAVLKPHSRLCILKHGKSMIPYVILFSCILHLHGKVQLEHLAQCLLYLSKGRIWNNMMKCQNFHFGGTVPLITSRVTVYGQKKICKYCAFRGTTAFYRGSTLNLTEYVTSVLHKSLPFQDQWFSQKDKLIIRAFYTTVYLHFSTLHNGH